MDKIQEKKLQILNDVCTSKDGLSWNELTEDLNELIEIVSSSTKKNEIFTPTVRVECEYPLSKRGYIGSNLLRCKLCGTEFK